MIDPIRIGVVGGGFTGAVVALQLCRHLPAAARIDIFEPRPTLGCGVAYSAADPSHRINVPASRMTVLNEAPSEFDSWARNAGVLAADPAALWVHDHIFPQRREFGRYVSHLLDGAVRARPDISFRHHRALVTDIGCAPESYVLGLSSGAAVEADLIVLAVSHPPPAAPALLQPLVAAGGPVILDPWAEGALNAVTPDAEVIIVGTGLTMADVVASLEARGHRGRIRAFSRRGLLSRGHPVVAPAKRDWFETAPPPRTAAALVRAVRQEVANANAEGEPWQAVFDDVRVNGRRLWQAMPIAEQRRLVRHIRPFWDVHRFRIAPQAEAAIARLRDAGQFTAIAASLTTAAWDGKRVRMELAPRGKGGRMTVRWEADAVVVTTGPAHGGILATNPALAALRAHGSLRMDPTGLGLDVDEASHAIGSDGRAAPGLLVAGPLARGRFGELMGLPQVSEHAQAVAVEVARMAEVRGAGAVQMAAAFAAVPAAAAD